MSKNAEGNVEELAHDWAANCAVMEFTSFAVDFRAKHGKVAQELWFGAKKLR